MDKIYNLYLDESGDFDRDLEKEHENECIVGGLLMDAANVPSEYELENKWISEWKKAFPDQSSQTRHEISDMLHHATDLSPTIKPKTVLLSLNMFSQMGEFIIFENYDKNRIVNSTITYANILSEGIVQLLLRLALENPNAHVKLNVLAGGRRDMTAGTGVVKYIDLTELKTRIDERIKLLEIKNESLRTLGASYNLSLGNDKKVTYLIMCDYICHFYFRRNAGIYRNTYIENGRSYSDVLMEKYDPRNIFSLKGLAERDRIAQHVSGNTYGSMLFDMATGLIEEELHINYGLAHFFMLPENSRRLHLLTLSNYFMEIIDVRRDLEMGERILSFGDKILSHMEKEDKRDDHFAMELLLYKLTLENHKGNLGKMEMLFKEGVNQIQGLMEYSENLDLVFMFLNRYAVFLIDSFDIEKSYFLLEKTIGQFETFELIGEELSSIYCNVLGSPSGASTNKSEQLGRLLGTEVQAAAYLMKHGFLDYETVIQISDRAIKNFITETDKQRQYQYRAMIEGYANHYEEALKYLLLGLGIENVVEGFQRKYSMNGFALYHLSLFLNNFRETEHKEIKELKKGFVNHEKDYLTNRQYPYFIVSGNVAEALSKDDKANKSQIIKYYKASIMYDDQEPELIKYLKLMMRCSYVAYLQRIKAKDFEQECEDVCRISDGLLKENISINMAKMLQNFQNDNRIQKYDNFSALRQY